MAHSDAARQAAEFLSEFLDHLVRDENVDAAVANQIVASSAPVVMEYALDGVLSE